MKGQISLIGLSLATIILAILAGSVTETAQNNGTLFYCQATDQTNLCLNMTRSKECVTDLQRDLRLNCSGGWDKLDINEIKISISQREQGDYIVNKNGRDWICNDIGKVSRCTFGSRIDIFSNTGKI